MADLTRAEELVRTIGRDAAFRAEVEAAPPSTAKREVFDAHGYADVGFDDMKAYVESQGGTLRVPERGHELSEPDLASVAGGFTPRDEMHIEIGIGTGIAVAAVAVV